MQRIVVCHRLGLVSFVHALLYSCLFACVFKASGLDTFSIEAARATATEYNALQQNISETAESFEKLDEMLSEVEKRIRLAPHQSAALKRVSDQLRATRDALGLESDAFKKFKDYSGKVSGSFEMMLQADGLLADAQNRRGGPLAKNLHLLAHAMGEFGDLLPVPLVSDAIQAYGKLTSGLLDATDALGNKLRDKFNAGALGGYGSREDERWQAFLKQFPEKAKGILLTPQEAPFVYQDQFSTTSPLRFVWDGEKWHEIDNGKLNVHQALLDSIQAGKRVDAERLLHMHNHADFYRGRGETALELYEYLNKLKKGIGFDTTYPRIFREEFGDSDVLFDALRDPELFRAYLTCDEHFSMDLNQRLLTLHAALAKADANTVPDLESAIKKLEFLAGRLNLHLAENAGRDMPESVEEVSDGIAILPVYATNTKDRSPISGVEVVAQNRETGKRYRTVTGSDGKGKITGMPAGSYRIGGRAESFQPYVTQSWNIFEANNAEVSLYLEPAVPSRVVTIRIVDRETQHSIAGALVSITGPKRYWQKTGGDGTTSFELGAGSWTVVGDAYGYAGQVSGVRVDPSIQEPLLETIALTPKPEELTQAEEVTEHNVETFEPRVFFASDHSMESPKSKAEDVQADSGVELPMIPDTLKTRLEINDWRDREIARIRKEGNAKLDLIRAELQKVEGQSIHHPCPNCKSPGPHFWDGHGWTCYCEYTVLMSVQYPTSAGVYQPTREHYLKIIEQINLQADQKLKSLGGS